MLDIPYVRGITLADSWHGPTPGLLDAYALGLRHGLAPDGAEQLRIAARPYDYNPNADVEKAIADLEAFVSLRHPIAGLGMTYGQLAVAAKTGPLAIFSLITKIDEEVFKNSEPGHVYFNPRFEPIESEGKEISAEPCFSCMAKSFVAEVERWRAIELFSDNRPPIILRGLPAVAAQHEDGHRHGKLCVDIAFETGFNVYYVPPELHTTFFRDFHRKGRRREYPHVVVRDQWEAVGAQKYSLGHYL